MFVDGLCDDEEDDDEVENWEEEWREFTRQQKERGRKLNKKWWNDTNLEDVVVDKRQVKYVDGTSDLDVANSADENLNTSKEDHDNIYPANYLLECEECKLRFTDETILEKHKTNTEPFFCRVALKKPVPKKNRKGTRITESEVPYVCNECERTLSTFSAVKNHLQAQHIGKSIDACELCMESFVTKADYDEHLEHHFTFWQEPRESETRIKQKKKVFVEKVPEEKGRMCEICGIGFTSTLDYEDHMDIEHAELSLVQEVDELRTEEALEEGEVKLDDKYHCCEFCGAGFEDLNEYITHMAKHKEDMEMRERLRKEQEQEEFEMLRALALKTVKRKTTEETVVNVEAEEVEEPETIAEELEENVLEEDEVLKQCVESLDIEQAADEEGIEQNEEVDDEADSDEDYEQEEKVDPTKPTWKSPRQRKSVYKFDTAVPQKKPISDFVFTCEICGKNFESMVKVRKHINDAHIKTLKVKEEKLDDEVDIEAVEESQEYTVEPQDESIENSTPMDLIDAEGIQELVEQDQDPDFSPEMEEESEEELESVTVYIKSEKPEKPISPKKSLTTPKSNQSTTFTRQSPRKPQPSEPLQRAENPITMITDANGKAVHRCNHCKKQFTNLRMAKRHVTNWHVRSHTENEHVMNIVTGADVQDVNVQGGLITATAETSEKTTVIEQALGEIERMESMEESQQTETEDMQSYLVKQDPHSLECKECRRSFDNRQGLIMHMVTVHGEKELQKCEYCGKEFNSMRQLRIHQAFIHKDKRNEKEAEQEDGKKESPKKRQREDEREVEEGAVEVKKGTKRQRMIYYIKKEPKDGEEYSPSKTTNKKQAEKTKTVKSKSGEMLECGECDKTFRTKDNLRIHQRMFHSGRNVIVKKGGQNRLLRANTHRFMCSDCHSKFQSQEDLAEHRQNPKCRVCNQAFDSCASFKKHRKTHTKKEWEKLRVTVCNLCGMSFSKPGGLRLHRLLHNICNYCDEQCESADDLTLHLSEQHPKLVNTICPHCGLRFTKKWNLDKHIAKYHDTNRTDKMEIKVSKDGRRRGRFRGDVICEYCGKKFDKPYEMKRHRNIHTGEKPCKCETCGESFPTPSQRSQHVNKVHKNKKYPCTVCGQEFKYPVARNRHMETHDDVEKKFTCELCGAQFIYKSSYNEHVKLQRCHGVHNAVPVRVSKFRCMDCGQFFQYDHTLVNHRIKDHDDREPYWCDNDDCSQRFPSAPDLIRHRKFHAGNIEYHCPHCSIEFPSESSLQFHNKQYHKARVHRSCSICGKVCKGDEAYEEHQKTHDDNDRQAVSCEHCGKNYGYKSALLRHLKQKHDPKKPHRCKVCQRRFETEAELNAHKMDRHPPGQVFACKFCPCQYNYLATLVRHMKEKHGLVHGGMQNTEAAGYVPYAKRVGLNILMNRAKETLPTVHNDEAGERVYKCRLCSASYHHVTSMNRHMREQHNVVEAPPERASLKHLKSSIKVVGAPGKRHKSIVVSHPDSDIGKLQIASTDSDHEDPEDEQTEEESSQEQVVYMVDEQQQDQQYVLSIPEHQEGVQYVQDGSNVQVITDDNGSIQVIDGATHGLEVLHQGVEYVTGQEVQEGVQYVTTDGQEIQYVQADDGIQYIVEGAEETEERQEYVMMENGNQVVCIVPQDGEMTAQPT